MTKAPYVVLVCCACSNPTGGTGGGDAGTEPAPARASSAPRPAEPRPWLTEVGRGGAECEFAGWEGEGTERRSAFTLTAPEGREPVAVHAWLFYYDEAGRHLGRSPDEIAWGSRQPVHLGEKGTKIPKGTSEVECEITWIVFSDKSIWMNANLAPDAPDRPRGGFTESELRAHAGEKVQVAVSDAATGKVKLTNLSDKEVRSLEVDLLFFDKDGRHETRSDYAVTITIAPKTTVETQVSVGEEPLPAFERVEATAPEVRFADGTRWDNKNLVGFELPSP